MEGLQLVLTVCSIVAGANCHPEQPIPLHPQVTMMGCMIGSQQEAAKWAANRPNWYVSKVTCEPVRRFART